jgi:hypothetical protein
MIVVVLVVSARAPPEPTEKLTTRTRTPDAR